MMELVTLDFETYYDKDYSLPKLTTEEYINDPRFQIIGVAVKYGDKPPQWYSPGDDLNLSSILADLNNHMVLCHNTMFDGAILSWKLGIRPKFLLDTLSMARAVLGGTERHSLAALAERYGLGAKGKEVLDAKGKRLEDFSPAELTQYARYCMNDVELTYRLFKKLGAGFPQDELRTIDMTLRMYTDPVLRLDQQTIQREIDLEQQRKDNLLASLGGGVQAKELRSNDKFAEVLRQLGVNPPTKVSAKTGKTTWAFAKNDADFKALMEHDDPAVRAAVEARLGHKSTQKATRAARFMGIAKRMGTLPVPLAYYSAHTGRYGGTDGINMQNLPRASRKDPDSGLLRKAIVAPPGHKLVVADLSQIEARLLVWQAGQDDKVAAFAQGRDTYSEQASVIYSRKIDRKNNPDDFVPGFIGKAVVLGCLGPDTKVFTSNGIKPITCVNDTDMVWDGEEWVTHSGVIPKGEKEVVRAHGLAATTDHEILTEHGWVEWSEVQASPSLFRSAIKSANSPFSTGYVSRQKAASHLGNLWFVAHAAEKGLSTARISLRGLLQGAGSAGAKLPTQRAKSTGGTSLSSRTTRSGSGCSTVLRPSSGGVARRAISSITTMGDAVSTFINRGLTTVVNSFVILFRSLGMTSRVGTWIASTTMGGTSPATFGLLRKQKTYATGERSVISRSVSPSSKLRIQTYDIAYAGPRNRFTVLTDAGPLIVHNCGYGLGHPRFGGMINVGMLGGPRLLFDEAFAEQLSVDVSYYARRLARDEDLRERIEAVRPAAIPNETWVTHMACADHIINTYRADNQMVKNYWSVAGEAIMAMYRGERFEFGGPDGRLLTTEQSAIVLPNGFKLLYPGLERKDGEFSCLRKKEGRIQRVKVYGGAVVENITQALARIVIRDNMLAVERELGCRVALQVHDEIVMVAPEDTAEEVYEGAISIMRTPPSWATGLPLDAEGGVATRYGDAK